MPVEIRELVLRAQVSAPHPAEQEARQADLDALRDEMRAMIEHQLRLALGRQSDR